MTCVLGIVVKREREIREFVKTPFYRVTAQMLLGEREFEAEWRAAEGSRYFQSPLLYKENGFKQRDTAEELIAYLTEQPSEAPVVDKLEKKKEMKNPPLLYNLAELQNDCSKYFRISPDETLRMAQELYEKKLTTYPRTDARVLSTAVSKEITKNLKGLCQYDLAGVYAGEVLETGMYGKLAKSRYVNDKQITDHYAIIPTGQGFSALRSLHPTAAQVYELIAKRFLSIFYPAAVYQKVSLTALVKGERFFSNFKVLTDEGYLRVAQCSFFKKKEPSEESQDEEIGCDASFLELLNSLKKGALLSEREYTVKEGETSPPKRYNSGTLILTMENAGQFIEDEELRAQIKGSGIGTSATRAEILKKLVNIKYLALNKKTQIITPTLLGELVYEVVYYSMRPMLNPSLTASWENGLTQVAEGTITGEEYMSKLDDFVSRRTNLVKQSGNGRMLLGRYDIVAQNYKRSGKNGKAGKDDSKKSV